MSILIVQVHAEGIIFAADCNVTTVAQDGTIAQDYVWRKVMKWPVQPGNSGGALVDERGNVVGSCRPS